MEGPTWAQPVAGWISTGNGCNSNRGPPPGHHPKKWWRRLWRDSKLADKSPARNVGPLNLRLYIAICHAKKGGSSFRAYLIVVFWILMDIEYTPETTRKRIVLMNLQSFLLPMLCSDGIPEEMGSLSEETRSSKENPNTCFFVPQHEYDPHLWLGLFQRLQKNHLFSSHQKVVEGSTKSYKIPSSLASRPHGGADLPQPNLGCWRFDGSRGSFGTI